MAAALHDLAGARKGVAIPAPKPLAEGFASREAARMH